MILKNRIEYDYVVSRGFQPLLLNQFFVIDHALRVEIQRELFGHSFISKGDVLKGNQRFYEWCWNNITGIEGEHICQNCCQELYEYSATFVSHILSRKNKPEIAHDPRNVNILCGKCHDTWEDINKRKSMNIYILNIRIIRLLLNEYK